MRLEIIYNYLCYFYVKGIDRIIRIFHTALIPSDDELLGYSLKADSSIQCINREYTIMKVQIQYLLQAEQPNEKDWLGRKVWVVKTADGLAFGNIYTDEDKASDLTEDDLKYLKDNAGQKYIIINQ